MKLKNVRVMLLAVMTAVLFAGCAEMKISTVPSTSSSAFEDVPHSESPQAQNLLNYAASLRGRNTSELNAELELINRAYAQHRTEDNRLRLAIFNAITPNGDRAKALSLLDLPPGESNGRGRNHPVALLLIPLLQENRRNDDVLLAGQQRLRDEQKRSEGLQQKLDAIRDIEKKMIERSSPSSPSSSNSSSTINPGKAP